MWVLYCAFIYFIIGVLFSIPFVSRFIEVIDEGVKGSHWTFKMIILPGCVALWPLLLVKLLNTRKSKRHGQTT